MHTDIQQLAQQHTAALRAEADAHRLAGQAGPTVPRAALRARLGWTLVELGLRLTAGAVPSPAAV
ncbi:hypothetical protein [Streptomyces sp. L2]|uniref:hypothetical protein n=1 Tax=Streptomyces sp. L2 TaxID=2162665 RepID=UPI001010E7E6|nr:hypothetical protein [Streptomyces sp. L2]